jgi:hypothetical protein
VIPQFLAEFMNPTAELTYLMRGYPALLAWIALGATADGLEVRKQIHPPVDEADITNEHRSSAPEEQ